MGICPLTLLRHAFSEDDLHSAELLARALAAVLHNNLLTRRIAEEGELDALTGLYNRRHLERRLAQEVARARQANAPLTLLLLDVDSYATVAAHAGGADGRGADAVCGGHLCFPVALQRGLALPGYPRTSAR